jgi:hypothetical protein
VEVLVFEIGCEMKIGSQRIIDQLMRGALCRYNVVKLWNSTIVSSRGTCGEGCGAITVPELLFAFKGVLQRLHRQPMVRMRSAIEEA